MSILDQFEDDVLLTRSGIHFNVFTPKVTDIKIEDIAHALSMQCRFGGHTKEFYSVAQHCVLMTGLVTKEYTKWALLHDAAETYLTDLPRPVKQHCLKYCTMETKVLECIADRFELPKFSTTYKLGVVDHVIPNEVLEADDKILEAELAQLVMWVDIPISEWKVEDLVIDFRHKECWCPNKAEAKFLETAYALGIK